MAIIKKIISIIITCLLIVKKVHLQDAVPLKDGLNEEVNPFVDAAKSFLEEALENRQEGGGLSALGGILQSFVQNGGGKQLGDMLTGGRTSDGNSNIAGDILSGLGSILSNQKTGEGSIDPRLIGSIVEMFAGGTSGNQAERDVESNNIPSSSQGIDWESMLRFASSFISSKDSKESSGLEGLLNLLPLLTGNLGGQHVHFADSDLEDVEEHNRSEKSSYLPPFLQNIYDYWEHFKKSDLGHTLWNKSGLENIFQLFTDQDGYFQVDRIFDSMENTSFRRRWIRSLSSFVAEWVKHISDPATQKRYLTNAQFIGNGFLKAQGYSKAAHFDQSRPAESLSFLTDAVFKRQFGLKINSATYIKPAVVYIQDVFKLGQSKGLSVSHLTSQEIESKLAETINGEVIEPVLRVWRAYRYSCKNPHCDRYLICVLNQKNTSQTTTGLKPGVTKIASLIASWFLPGRTGTPFWKLYNAATEEHNCLVKYPVDCKEFHEEDYRVTTEYAHNEL